VTDFSETDQSENVSNIFYQSFDVINLNLVDNSSLHSISDKEDYVLTFLFENLDDTREYKFRKFILTMMKYPTLVSKIHCGMPPVLKLEGKKT
jgi:hypothetical protein